MISSYIYKWALLLGLLLGYAASVFAQEDANLARAERAYDFFAAGQGDSLYTMFNKDLKANLSPALFNNLFSQTESQVGKFQSRGEWQTTDAQGVKLYYSDLKFQNFGLRFLLAFDADGSMNTIRLMPVPAAAPAAAASKPAAYDKEKMLERDITVGTDGYKLPGTLTMPVGRQKAPVVILVHGSGPQDRDETIGPNKPFRDLAWGLAELGIATIRYDKRTKVYGSDFVPAGREMNYDTETVDDAVAIAAWAKTQPEFYADSVYVLGHSQGGLLAPRIAERADGLAGIILVAGLARTIDEAIVEQMTYISSLKESSAAAQQQIAEIKRQADNIKKLGTPAYDETIPLFMNIPRPYWEFSNAYKPVEVAKKLTLPMLILQGERDYQVTMEDFGMWRTGLSGKKNVSFKSYPKLNHILQEGVGKATPDEYKKAIPVAGYVIDDIASFIHSSCL